MKKLVCLFFVVTTTTIIVLVIVPRTVYSEILFVEGVELEERQLLSLNDLMKEYNVNPDTVDIVVVFNSIKNIFEGVSLIQISVDIVSKKDKTIFSNGEITYSIRVAEDSCHPNFDRVLEAIERALGNRK